MAAGPLRERITIQAKTLTNDGMGGYSEVWADVATVWGRTWGATGQERALAGMSEQPTVNRHFKVRHYPALTEQHRLVYAGQSYNIRFINHIPQDGWTFFDGVSLTGRSAN